MGEIVFGRLSVVILLFAPFAWAAIPQPVRVSEHVYRCVNASTEAVVSNHHRFDTAETACRNASLVDPFSQYVIQGGEYEMRGNWPTERRSNVVTSAPFITCPEWGCP